MVIIIIAIGYFVAHKGWGGESVTSFISKLIVNITLPCTAITAFVNNFTAETISDAWTYILASFAAIAIAFVISKLFIKIGKIDKTQRGVFTALFAFSNSVSVSYTHRKSFCGSTSNDKKYFESRKPKSGDCHD